MSTIAAKSLLALKRVKGSVEGDMFYDFVCTKLLPKLMPFNGTNSVLLDICSIHHVQELQGDAQMLTHYLPLDFNPIELAFSKVKYMLKARHRDDSILSYNSS